MPRGVHNSHYDAKDYVLHILSQYGANNAILSYINENYLQEQWVGETLMKYLAQVQKDTTFSGTSGKQLVEAARRLQETLDYGSKKVNEIAEIFEDIEQEPMSTVQERLVRGFYQEDYKFKSQYLTAENKGDIGNISDDRLRERIQNGFYRMSYAEKQQYLRYEKEQYAYEKFI